LAGGTGSVTATVANIDKTAPVGTITYSPTPYISWDIIATLASLETITITNNGWLPTRTFTGNTSFIFDFVDLAGNTGSTTATVNYWTGA
jgi:hypothetical protein